MGIILNEALIFSDEDTLERNKQEKIYLDYIKDHISKVHKVYELYMIPLLNKNNISSLISDEELKNAIISCKDRIDHHDDSKFSDDEFDAYRAKYYPTRLESIADDNYKRSMEDAYQEAWRSHYTNNPHHPEHWLDHESNIAREMDLVSIIEMICDWEAMSLKFGTSTLDWYNNDAKDEKKCLNPKTKEIVEDLLFNVIHNS